MASLDFPSNPTNGQTYALNGVTYYYNSSIGAWLTQLTSMNLSTSSNTQVLFNDAGIANGSSGLVFNKVAGYLGIGTTTPNSSLHLSSSSRTYISVTANAKDWLIDHRGTYDSGSNALSFAYDGTERMRITSAGYVGIGNTAPVSPLHVAGEIFAGRVDSSSEGGQVSFARASDNSLLYAIDVAGTGSSPEFRLFNQAAGTVFFSSAPAGVNYIKFNPTQMAIGDANVLDDYEEGTWTPTITQQSANPTGITYNRQHGNYIKIGTLVVASFNLYITAITNGSGVVRIASFPFACENVSEASRSGMTINYCSGFTSTNSPTGCIFVNGATYIDLTTLNSADGRDGRSTYVTNTGTSVNLYATVIYRTAN